MKTCICARNQEICHPTCPELWGIAIDLVNMEQDQRKAHHLSTEKQHISVTNAGSTNRQGQHTQKCQSVCSGTHRRTSLPPSRPGYHFTQPLSHRSPGLAGGVSLKAWVPNNMCNFGQPEIPLVPSFCNEEDIEIVISLRICLLWNYNEGCCKTP